MDEYYKVSPVFVLIFKGETVRPFPGGLYIQQPIQYAPLKAGPFAPGSTFDISYVQTDTAMTFAVKFYYANVTIQGTQLPINMGSNAVMSFVEEKMVNGSQALAQALATDIYNDGQGTVSLRRSPSTGCWPGTMTAPTIRHTAACRAPRSAPAPRLASTATTRMLLDRFRSPNCSRRMARPHSAIASPTSLPPRSRSTTSSTTNWCRRSASTTT